MSRHTELLFIIVALVLTCVLKTARAESMWLSDLDLSRVDQEWGEAKKDQSVEGNALRIAGKVYERGVGTHASSTMVVDLGGSATRFTAVVGIDDEAGAAPAPVKFRVVGDGKTLWSSEALNGGEAATAVPVDVDLTGVKQLKLLVQPTEGRINSAHVNWADAKIEYAGRAPVVAQPPPPVILTPPAPPTPRVNGPSVFGVTPGSPFLYTIPATGDRPMTFAAVGLPTGLRVDPATGRITGKLSARGEHAVTLRAKNALGEGEKAFRIVVGDTIALTPPMGWNSWNVWGEEVDHDKVMRSARAMVSSGLVNHGWTYVNIDDAWQGVRGGPFNAIQAHPERFPDMKALCDEVHALGLKVGIYSSPWMETYGGRIGGSADNAKGAWTKSDRRAAKNNHTKPYDVGQYSFATNDAKQWAAWGIDYLKYDWGPVDVKNSTEMRDALRASGRDIVYSLSNNHVRNIFPIIEGLAPTANAWRTTGDINDSWGSVRSIGFEQDAWAPHQSPGHYNDSDMLVVGNVGWGRPHPTKLTPDEQYTHVSLWSMLACPLLLGCELDKLDPFTLGLLTNDEVLAVNQDPLCKQATTVISAGDLRVYVKELEDGSRAVGLFNLGGSEETVTADFATLKIGAKQTVRDLWRQNDLGEFDGKFEATVPSHGVVLVRMTEPK